MVYNSNIARYDWHAQEPPEESCNQTVHVKLEKEVDRLQLQVQKLQGQLGINNLDPIVLDDLQMEILDEDDDDAVIWIYGEPGRAVDIKNESMHDDDLPALVYNEFIRK